LSSLEEEIKYNETVDLRWDGKDQEQMIIMLFVSGTCLRRRIGVVGLFLLMAKILHLLMPKTE